ncbi:MAG: pyrophosphatase [Candidatus Brocadia fulgida]|uniref:Pyrophosphatase n=1 Tax=Candidatus Brocadia fulgida TaxID=380242 RepID=A0A0M2UVR2_9BACT|nr:MAG: pyrophosphatase [Candidatus Brocadia fulgida]
MNLMKSFLRKPIFKNNQVSIVMILLMLTILILGVSKSGLLSPSAHAQGAGKSGEERPQFELGESAQKERPLFALDGAVHKEMADTSDTIPKLWWIAPVGALFALFYARKFYREVMKSPDGNDTMKLIAGHVREGAYAYLKQQYKVVGIFFVGAFLVLLFISFGLHAQSKVVPFAFLSSGFLSGLAGFLGMKTATSASSRTAEGARKSLNQGLQVAFRSGAVMGLIVVGMGLLDISLWFFVFRKFTSISLLDMAMMLPCFGIGASSQALFARVGGGIFTKAADVGADLVGKVEAGIPEDDPRNPATIADNVGDNVGDVAGMGADLYESYYNSMLACAALGVTAGLGIAGMVVPMILAGLGIFLSIIGIYAVKTKEEASQKELLKALGKGINLSSVLILISSAVVIKYMLPQNFGIWGSIVTGLIAGVIVGKGTEYYTSSNYSPTKGIAGNAKTGPATVIIDGIATGMMSTIIPVITISAAILLSYAFAGGFSNISLGLYGIAIAAVGMLSTLGLTLATDAYGPIADNAGGNAEMSGLEPYVRERTDALDALGNTTAATGKGFAIGSAALTAMALIASFVEQIKVGLERSGTTVIQVAGTSINLASAKLSDLMGYLDVTLINPKVLIGLFIGGMASFVFSAMTMKAVGRAAGSMVEEVRRQFREIAGIMEGTGKPDYAACVAISTKGAQREMFVPALLALLVPIVTGLILGVPGVVGLLAGSLTVGSCWQSLWPMQAAPGITRKSILKAASWAERVRRRIRLQSLAIRWETPSKTHQVRL